MMIDVSIIIPVYNVESYVEDCIRSVMSQTGIDDISVECILVDDRGTDNSMTVIRQTLQEYKSKINFRIIERENNGGLSAARNSGIKVANGKYLYFLDSDDTITSDCISRLWAHVKRHPDVEIVFGKTVIVPNREQSKEYYDLSRISSQNYISDSNLLDKIYLIAPVNAWNKLIKRDWVESNQLYFREGILFEDNHWQLLSYNCIHSIALENNPTPTYLYLMRKGSIMSSNTGNDRILQLGSSLLELTPYMARMNKYILSRYCETLFDLRSIWHIANASEIYQNILRSLKINKKLNVGGRLFTFYMGLPNLFFKGIIARYIIRYLA